MPRDRPNFSEDRDANRSTQSPEGDYEPHDQGLNAQRFVGQTIDLKFEILELVGQGGMSAVYRAKHTMTQKIVALKLMHSRLITDNNSVRRFQQEATAAGRMQHQNAISVSDMGVTEDGQPYLTMEFLEGWSLSEVIQAYQKLEVKRCFHIFQQACSALAHAHQKGIVHRDLKPSNIMLIRNGIDADFVKIVDFGIAKILPQGGEGLKLTATGEIFGSPLYMSPEQCMGLPLDGRSDIYSMGCLMYESLSGHAPLEGRNMMETMYKQMNDQADALTDLEGDVRQVKRLDEIIQKCMAKKPENRYQSMYEIEEDLHRAEKAVGGSKVAAKMGLGMTQAGRTLRNQTGPRWKLIFGLVGFVAVLAIAVTWGINEFFSTAGDPESKERHLTLSLKFSNPDDEARLDAIEKMKLIRLNIDKAINGKGESDDSTKFYQDIKYGDFYMRLGSADKALKCFADAVKSITKTQLAMLGSDYAHLLRGEAFCDLINGDYAKAEQHATNALYLLDHALQSKSSMTRLSTLGLLTQIYHHQNDPRLQVTLRALAENYAGIRDREYDLEPDYPYASAVALKQGADAAIALGWSDFADWMYHSSLLEWVHLEGGVGLEKVALDEGVLLNDLGLLAVSRHEYKTDNSDAVKADLDKLDLQSILKGNSLRGKGFDLKAIAETSTPLSADPTQDLTLRPLQGLPAMKILGAIDYFKMAASRISQSEPVSERMAIVLFNLADAYRADKNYVDASKTRLEAQKILRDYGKGQ